MSQEKIKGQDSLYSFPFHSLSDKFSDDLERKDILKGYLSVEASLVFPIVLALLFLLILLIFHLYGRVVLSSTAYGGAIRASGLKDDDLHDFLSRYKGFGLVKEETLGSWDGKLFMYKEKDRMIVDIQAKMFIPIPFIPAEDKLRVGDKVKAVRMDAVKIIRNTRMLEEAVESLKEDGDGERSEKP